LEQWEASGTLLEPELHRTGVEPDSVLAPRRDYRHEGLLIGGLVLGVAGAWAGSQISGGCSLSPGGGCYNNDRVGQAVALGLLGAVVGGGFGYLIGRLSPKVPARDSLFPGRPRSLASIPDSVRQRVSYQHWRGGALGLTIGAAVGVVTGAIIGDGGCDDCGQQPNATLTAGLVGAGAGGLLGFFAGLASPKYQVIRTSNSEP
jgi:hypothetical protein